MPRPEPATSRSSRASSGGPGSPTHCAGTTAPALFPRSRSRRLPRLALGAGCGSGRLASSSGRRRARVLRHRHRRPRDALVIARLEAAGDEPLMARRDRRGPAAFVLRRTRPDAPPRPLRRQPRWPPRTPLGYPVALKAAAPALVHKTDVGGVALGLADAAAVRRAYGGHGDADRCGDGRRGRAADGRTGRRDDRRRHSGPVVRPAGAVRVGRNTSRATRGPYAANRADDRHGRPRDGPLAAGFAVAVRVPRHPARRRRRARRHCCCASPAWPTRSPRSPRWTSTR